MQMSQVWAIVTAESDDTLHTPRLDEFSAQLRDMERRQLGATDTGSQDQPTEEIRQT